MQHEFEIFLNKYIVTEWMWFDFFLSFQEESFSNDYSICWFAVGLFFPFWFSFQLWKNEREPKRFLPTRGFYRLLYFFTLVFPTHHLLISINRNSSSGGSKANNITSMVMKRVWFFCVESYKCDACLI